MILPEVISKEPLGPAVRHNDNHWGDLVRWVFYSLLTAEENGITKDNVYNMVNSSNPEIKRLLGIDGNLGEALGLPNDFVIKVIAEVGNYGEIFSRNVGPNSQLKLDRGYNNLWMNGGLMYSPPFR